ncbi:Pheromone receptor transcription factor, putative [Pediculus humanus corporis]|uniref:Serum response factor homolog n=1 Tax=Pediculus humanus subsp. corporis TaxID=121224 RepID=E0VYQ3_PEDHC|nr:Pheromone receptor transcription factor, putative [Pediculus humanus corporis]EEB18509.1 Pheromone receptor transcription factor, putative [Pediculus humanus corporis]
MVIVYYFLYNRLAGVAIRACVDREYMLAMEAQGGGRDTRFNLGYNMSMLSGESSPDMYSGHGRASSSLNTAIARNSLLPTSCNVGIPRGIKRTSSDVCFDQEVTGGRPMTSQPLSINTDISSELVDDGYTQVQQSKKTPPPNGKKTKGRVKIKMEYIDNKLRRYTTFFKRKTGIMKKAYELSTLTGTQVMLLVASETGHVYTFATRKLQPMITSEAGKALIQTCLNSPDPAPSSVGGDQRMSATGFEETELTYNISDEEQKVRQLVYGGSPHSHQHMGQQHLQHYPGSPHHQHHMMGPPHPHAQSPPSHLIPCSSPSPMMGTGYGQPSCPSPLPHSGYPPPHPHMSHSHPQR